MKMQKKYEKHENSRHLEGYGIKIFMLAMVLLGCVLLIFPLIHAEKTFEKIEIKDKSNNKLSEVELIKNSNICSDDCFAEGNIKLYKESKLIEKIRFLKEKNGKWKETQIKDYKFYIKKNGIYVLYDNSILLTGTYEWKLEGKKNIYDKIDWLITVNGKELNDWAIWYPQLSYVYDDFSDGVWNSTKWINNSYDSSGSGVSYVKEVAGAFIGYTDDLNNAINVWHWYNITDNFPLLSRLNNISFNLITSMTKSTNCGTGGETQTNNYNLFGYTESYSCATVSLNRNFSLVRNNNTHFNVTINNVFNKSVTPAQTMLISADINTGTLTGPMKINNTLIYLNYSYIDSGYVVLSSSGSIFPLTSINLNCTSIAPYGYTLTNTSIWTNSTGTWHLNQTGTLTGSTDTKIFNIDGVENGNYIYNCYSCDNDNTCSFSNSNATFQVNTSYYTQNSETFSYSTIEGSVEAFSLNMTLGNEIILSSASLVYDGTNYNPAILISGNYYYFSKNLNIPFVTSTTNKSFYWSLNTNNGYINSSSHSQTIADVSVDNCSSNSLLLYNFTLKDEELQTFITNATGLNTSIEIDLNFYSTAGSSLMNLTKKYYNVSSAPVCFNSSINMSTYIMNGVIRYSADGYAPEYYNFQRQTITNLTFNQTINLFDLKSADSTEFTILYKDSSFVPQKDVLVIIQRKYVSEGVYKTVEIPITDLNGQAVGHFDTDGVTYSITLTKNGVVLDTFNNIAVICQNALYSECNINLNSLSSTSSIYDFSTYDNLNYYISFNQDTNTVSSVFNTIDGTSSTMLLNVTKYDMLGNTTLCSDSLYGSSGTLGCSVPASYGNVTLLVRLFKDNELVMTETYSIVPETQEIFGTDGYVFLLILIITLPLMFVPSYFGVIFGIIIGLVCGGILVLYNGGSLFGTVSVIIWGILAGGIIIWKANQHNAS